jgi:hypothetical protein
MLCLAMAAAYSSEPWHDLFVGVSGAAAVLTGLLFVSLSINLAQILGQVWLPRRAALTLMLLFEALVIAILGLVPGQSPTTFAVELLSVGGAVWLFATGVFTVRRPAIDQLAPDRGERGGGAAGDAVLTSAAQRTPLGETEDGEL